MGLIDKFPHDTILSAVRPRAVVKTERYGVPGAGLLPETRRCLPQQRERPTFARTGLPRRAAVRVQSRRESRVTLERALAAASSRPSRPNAAGSRAGPTRATRLRAGCTPCGKGY